MKKDIPWGRILTLSDRDDEPVQLTLTRGQLSVLIGQCRSGYRYAEKQAAAYVRQHGKPFEPGPGKHDITRIARDRFESCERALCAAVGVASMFESMD